MIASGIMLALSQCFSVCSKWTTMFLRDVFFCVITHKNLWSEKQKLFPPKLEHKKRRRRIENSETGENFKKFNFWIGNIDQKHNRIPSVRDKQNKTKSNYWV